MLYTQTGIAEQIYLKGVKMKDEIAENMGIALTTMAKHYLDVCGPTNESDENVVCDFFDYLKDDIITIAKEIEKEELENE